MRLQRSSEPSAPAHASRSPQEAARARPRLLPCACLAAFCGALAGAASASAFAAGVPGVARGSQPTHLRSRSSRVARGAEAFDPFGWKGQFKDTVQGLQDAISGPDEEPSKLEEQMIIEIFSKYDLDKDGFLNLEEFNDLQVATEGNEAIYKQDQLDELLGSVNPKNEEREKGMPFEDYRRLYVERRLRQAYSTDVMRDHVKIFGPGGGAAAAAAAAEMDKEAEAPREGTSVTIQGLQGAQELNGQTGQIVAPVESEAELVAEGRVIVQLPDGDRVALRPANVRAAA